jgi:ArsR family transcriptional regulator
MSNYPRDELDRYAEIFRALGNPHRLAIFLRLVHCCAPEAACCEDGRDCPCVGEFAVTLGLAPSTVSHHMKELQRSGLVRTERRGQAVHCWVAPETLADLARFFLGRAAQCPGISDEQVQHMRAGWEAEWPKTS